MPFHWRIAVTSNQMHFVTNPSRDAGPTIAGFFFQVNVSILRWIDLGPSQHLELESGEDIDTVDRAGDENAAAKRLLEQLKIRSSRSLTLRNVEALEALANYCTHTHLNPGTLLLFRYLTATIGHETDWGGTQPAIATWQAIREVSSRSEMNHSGTTICPASSQVGSARRRFRDGWRFCNTPIKCSLLTWVYRCVVAIEACPRNS